jgi:uncharacterized glyoxalase superfamily protein PhnB
MGQAKPIPDGYHSVQPQLVFQDCAKAIAFYQKAFGAREHMRMPGPGGKIMHAELQIGDSKVFMMDAMPGSAAEPPTAQRPSPVSVCLYVPDVDATWKTALAAGAKETMPLQDQFWGDRAGMLTDPFGYSWFVATHVTDMSEDEMRRAGEEAMRRMQQQGASHP